MSIDEYWTEYEKSIKDPDIFWAEKASSLSGLKNLLK